MEAPPASPRRSLSQSLAALHSREPLPAHRGGDHGDTAATTMTSPQAAVGYADLWALAAITAIEWAGGPSVPFRAGRTDVKSSAECVAEGRLPDGDKGASHIRQVFNRMGFNDSESLLQQV